MTATAKIRILLALICAALLLTTIVVQQTYTPKVNLEQAAKTLETALHEKEEYVNKYLGNPARFEQLKGLNHNEGEGIATINDLTTKNHIWLSTLVNGRLSFWSGIKVLAGSAVPIKEGRSFIKRPNGYYEAVKKTRGNFSAVFFIPVKNTYAIQNDYLQNVFNKDLTADSTLELADFTDKDVYSVHSIDNQYLFSVKVKKGLINQKFYILETVLWVLNLMLVCLLIHMLCHTLVKKGKLWAAVALLAGFIILMRFANLVMHWPGYIRHTGLFNPLYYSSGKLFPSFGDFCINVLLVCWLAGFIYNYRHKLVKSHISNKAAGYVIVVLCTAFLLGILSIFVDVFHDLVVGSGISFDINNVLNLTALSVAGLVMVCFNFLIFNLVDETLLVVIGKTEVPVTHRIIIFAAGVAIVTIVASLHGAFTLFYILAGLVVAVRAWLVWYNRGKLNAPAFIAITVICAFIASVKLTTFQAEREHRTRIGLIKKLEMTDDSTADYIFKSIEQKIITDPYLLGYFRDAGRSNAYLRTYLRKNYFDGYLSKYGIKIYEFDQQGNPLTKDNIYVLDNFRDMVLYSAFKVSKYFYRENDSFGYQSYFALLPVQYQGTNLGTFVVALQSKPIQYTESSPELLLDSRLKQDNEYKGYSYAFYRDNNLLNQSGDYIYNILNKDFNVKPHRYQFKNTTLSGQNWFSPAVHYNHLIYKPSDRKLIVISKREYPVLNSITSLTFFFVVMLIFNVLVIGIRWLWGRVRLLTITDTSVRWRFSFNLDHILYKTRIQFSMIFAVVVTLLLVAIITYFSISNQYQEQQNSSITDRILRIASALEDFVEKDTDPLRQETQLSFTAFAQGYSTDLTLFSRNGDLIFTTKPKIYDLGLLAPKMNGRAFIYMSKLQKSEYVNQETVGDLKYKAGYAPIRNNKGRIVAFLQLPFFSNELEYSQRIGSLVNDMINIYAIILILIGMVAILIARQITWPLSFIQQKISRTQYGRKNEPIIWNREDEIGALVKEYNKMLGELENSAEKLARSERESAWREMAKQVAHEIKNPLTPLKLGLQLLEKSWRDKDPKFDAKFERFSKSFVEQIESLSTIASEFSAFAKMPEARMERVNVFDILWQAITVYRQMDNVQITINQSEEPYYINADRDQLLRCFNNLLKNAIEAMPPGQQGLIHVDYEIKKDRILVKITDNGGGIPENLRTRIFAPNFTTKSSGTGLGLAFVKNSIENIDGRVWFETELGKGTTFFLNLPAA